MTAEEDIIRRFSRTPQYGNLVSTLISEFEESDSYKTILETVDTIFRKALAEEPYLLKFIKEADGITKVDRRFQTLLHYRLDAIMNAKRLGKPIGQFLESKESEINSYITDNAKALNTENDTNT